MTGTQQKTDMQMEWFDLRVRQALRGLSPKQLKKLSSVTGLTVFRIKSIINGKHLRWEKFETIIMLLNGIGRTVEDYMPENPKLYPKDM